MKNWFKLISKDLDKVEKEVLGHVIGPQTPEFGGKPKKDIKKPEKKPSAHKAPRDPGQF